jgi:hypothetical protein
VIGGSLLTGRYDPVIGACFGTLIYGVVQCRPCPLVQTQGPALSDGHGSSGA